MEYFVCERQIWVKITFFLLTLYIVKDIDKLLILNFQKKQPVCSRVQMRKAGVEIFYILLIIQVCKIAFLL